MCEDSSESSFPGVCWWKSRTRPEAFEETVEKETFSLSGGAFVELTRGVIEKGACFRLMARGWSMFPSIQDGDALTISPFRDIRPYAGEVVAFSKPDNNRLVVHRIIRITDGSYLIKGDNNLFSDGVIPEANLLGVVIKVERNGKALYWPDRFRQRRRARLYFSWKPAFVRLLGPAWSKLSFVAVYVTHSRVYRLISKRLLNTRVKKVDLSVFRSDQPKRLLKSDVNGLVTEDQDAPARSTGQEKMVVVASVNNRWIGHMTFLQSPVDCPFRGWWVGDGDVLLAYKGCGLEARMFAKAEEALSSRGVSSIMINLPADSQEMETWYIEVGMKIKSPGDGCSKCADSRILLEKRIDIKADGQ